MMSTVRSSRLRVMLGLDLDKGVAAVAERVGQHGDRVLDRFGIVPVAGLYGQQRQHRFARQVLQLDVDIDLAELVALAFLDREGDDEAVAVGGQLGDRRDDAEIGIALGQVELAQQLAVVGQPVGIVGVVDVDRKRYQRLSLVSIDAAQRAVAELAVADEVDRCGRRSTAPSLISKTRSTRFSGSWMTLGSTVAAKRPLTAVELEDAPDIVLHAGARIDDARAQLDLGVEVLVGDLRVSLEGDAVDDRVLDDPDDQRIALADQLHIGEQPGREQRLQRAVDPLGVPGVARLEQQIGAHRFRLDPLDALDPDIGDRARPAAAAGGACGGRRCASADDSMPLAAPEPAASTASQRNVTRFGPKTPTPTACAIPSTVEIRSRSASQDRRSRVCTRSFQVANTISVSTSASPMRKPYSCARWPSGLPRIASAA